MLLSQYMDDPSLGSLDGGDAGTFAWGGGRGGGAGRGRGRGGPPSIAASMAATGIANND